MCSPRRPTQSVLRPALLPATLATTGHRTAIVPTTTAGLLSSILEMEEMGKMKQVTFQLFSHIQTYASIDFHFLNNFTLPPMEIVGSRTALNPLPHRMPLLRPSTHLRHLQPRLRPLPPQRLRQLPPPPPLPSLGTGINSPGYRLLVICRHTPTVTIRINLTVLQNRKSAYCSGSPMPLVRQSLVLRNSAVPEGNSEITSHWSSAQKTLVPRTSKSDKFFKLRFK